MTRPTSRTAIFAPSVPKVMICATERLAVFLADVVDDLGAAVVAEIDVDIGRRDALGIEEALEEEAVVERVDIGDAKDVGDQRCPPRCRDRGRRECRGVLRAMDEIPDDQEITDEARLLHDLQFELDAVDDLFLLLVLGLLPFDTVAVTHPLLAQMPQVMFPRETLRRVVNGKPQLAEFHQEIAFLGDGQRVLSASGVSANNSCISSGVRR